MIGGATAECASHTSALIAHTIAFSRVWALPRRLIKHLASGACRHCRRRLLATAKSAADASSSKRPACNPGTDIPSTACLDQGTVSLVMHMWRRPGPSGEQSRTTGVQQITHFRLVSPLPPNSLGCSAWPLLAFYTTPALCSRLRSSRMPVRAAQPEPGPLPALCWLALLLLSLVGPCCAEAGVRLRRPAHHR